ncbi:MAG: MlaD family protein, partial [Planctomycetota bacterium]
MSSTPVNRNNVLAGVFVIASLLLAVAIAFVLGDMLDAFGSKRDYIVRFPTEVGVAGLQPGADVTFAGLSVGRVESIEPHKPEGETATAMDVRIAIDTRIVLYEDALADLSPPLLGGVSTINFASAGTGTVASQDPLAALTVNNGNGTLEEGETLRGRYAPSILAQLGFSVEDAQRIRNTIADVERASADVVEMADRFNALSQRSSPEIEAAILDARAAVGDVRTFASNFTSENGWKDRVDNIFNSTEETLERGPAIVAEIRDTIARTRAIVEDNETSIRTIISNVEFATERFN